MRLRSSGWLGSPEQPTGTTTWMMNQGTPADLFDGRPVVGIANTWSQFTPCNGHLRELAEHVREGVLEAGGFPVEFPAMSLGETIMKPTTMLYRNLLAMETEESIRANPCDGVILLCGCDKTTPGLLMGAASVDLPTIVVSGGPMLNGWCGTQRLGNGTTGIKMRDAVSAGEVTPQEAARIATQSTRSAGSCNTMGTASTMASMSEALGVALPQNGAIPAVDARRRVNARLSGRAAVERIREQRALSSVLTREAFENAVRIHGAIAGSTNAVLHLLAVAGRIGVEFTLDDWDALAREVPCLVNLMPSGEYLMEDFYYAGGPPAVMREIQDLLHLEIPTVSGRTVGENIDGAENLNPQVILSRSEPLAPQGGMAILRGNLAPGGAVLKPSAASPELMRHRGRAVVFDDILDYHARIDSDDLDVDASCVLVLRRCGPKGFPGMPEVGNMKLPQKLLRDGVRDMVRISDARMSGTAFGTVVLHTAPEGALPGPLAAVRDGDMIELDVDTRSLRVDIDDAELERRIAELPEPEPGGESGWAGLYVDRVLQADRGVDMDFLVGSRGSQPR